MDFPCAANSCMVFTVPLLSMATSCMDENNISHKSTAFLGVGQFFSCCSPFNYNLLFNIWSRTYQIGKDFLMSDTRKKQAVREYMLVAYVWEKKSYQEMYQIVINSLLMRAG